MFLVPTAMMAAISAITAQNIGAGKKERASQSLKYGMLITMAIGVVFCTFSQVIPQTLIAFFSKDGAVIVSNAHKKLRDGI